MHLQAVTAAAQLLGLCLLLAPISCPAASLDEKAANAYCNGHRAEWSEIWNDFGVDPSVAEAVVFPEIIRFSLLQDKMETAAVRGTYIKFGTQGFDFSIGRFQMKPSFIETLEKRWMRSGLAATYGLYFDTKDSEMARKVRISRLEEERWQCVYLAMFLKMLYLDYGSLDKRGERAQDGIDTLPVREQVRLAATAYNHGCRWVNPGYGPLEEIQALCRDKCYHAAVVPTKNTRRYVYADIAVKHWNKTNDLYER